MAAPAARLAAEQAPVDGPLVALRDVDFSYDERPVLRRISFALGAGEFVGIVGPNGSGKSTLIDLIDGIHQPVSGEVLVKDLPTRRYRRRDMAREVALVPQHFDLDFDLDVREVVEMGAYCRGKDPAASGDPDHAALAGVVIAAGGRVAYEDPPTAGQRFAATYTNGVIALRAEPPGH